MEDSGAIVIDLHTINTTNPQLLLTAFPESGSVYDTNDTSAYFFLLFVAKIRRILSSNIEPLTLTQEFSFIRQWASEVVNFSSSWGSTNCRYSAERALFRADCYPNYGDCYHAWLVFFLSRNEIKRSPVESDSYEFLTLKFAKAVYIVAVVCNFTICVI